MEQGVIVVAKRERKGLIYQDFLPDMKKSI
jgi:hypothetical protein